MKKFLASLIVAAMLFIPFGIAMAQPAPLSHKAMWYLGDQQIEEISNWIMGNGQLNFMLLLVRGIALFKAPTPDGFTLYFLMNLQTAEGFIILEKDGLSLFERYGDGNLEVDAVYSNNIDAALYKKGEDVPSIYSTTYMKSLYYFYHNHVFQPEIVDGP